MITINKKLFESPLNLQKMTKLLAVTGMSSESPEGLSVDEINLTLDQETWIEQFSSTQGKEVKLEGRRQSGRSSTGLAMILTHALFESNKHSMIVTGNLNHSQGQKRRLLNYLQAFCERFSLPNLVKSNSVSEIELVTGSKIYFLEKQFWSKNSFRGFNLENVFIDCWNVHSMDDLDEEILCCIMPCVQNKLIVSLGA
jgi:hypothetical protein